MGDKCAGDWEQVKIEYDNRFPSPLRTKGALKKRYHKILPRPSFRASELINGNLEKNSPPQEGGKTEKAEENEIDEVLYLSEKESESEAEDKYDKSIRRR